MCAGIDAAWRRNECPRSLHDAGLLAKLSAHRELATDIVPQRIAEMTARRIRFINFRERVTVTVRLPPHAFKVLDQLFALGINPQASLSGLTVQHRVYAVDPIPDQRIGSSYPVIDPIVLRPKEFLDNLPIRPGSRRMPAVP